MSNGKCSASDAQVQEIKEIFLPVVGFESRYKISNLGNLISINGLWNGEKLINPSKSTKGYVKYTLTDKKQNKNKCALGHRIVAEAFLTNPENKPQVNHINGIKTDNRVSNLEWVTSKENMNHAIDNGLLNNRNGFSKRCKLTTEQVKEIRELYHAGNTTYDKLRLAYNVEKTTIASIINNKTWQYDSRQEYIIPKKDKTKKGESNNFAKYSEDIILQIRALFSTGKYRKSKLSQMFNISATSISRIVKRESWKHI